MKRNVLKLLLVTLIFAVCISLVSCGLLNKDPGEVTPPNDGDGDPKDPALEGLVLIENGAPCFNIIVSTGAGSAVIRHAENLASDLKALGVSVNVYLDSDDDIPEQDCELLIGTALKGRGDDMNISARVLGDGGYIIKAVGEKIIIAGGTSALTKKAIDLFKEEYLGITEETSELKNAAVPEDLLVEQITKYDIENITILEKDLSEYVVAYDTEDTLVEGMVKDMTNLLYERAGYIISAQSISSVPSGTGKIIVRSTDYAGTDGFRAYIKGDDLVIECAYINAFDEAFDRYMAYQFSGEEKTVAIDKGYSYTDHVSTVRYSDFGAVGDGVTDDFIAIYQAHEYANLGGQKVYAEDGKTYYLGEDSIGLYITVKTDVDFGTATFIIDDTILAPNAGAGAYRKLDIFNVKPDASSYQISDPVRNTMSFTKGQANVGLTFDEAKLLHIVNNDKKIYIRYGSNANSGSAQAEFILVDAEGNVDESTPIMWNYDKLTSITVYSAGDKAITLSGGTFITWACKLWEMEEGSGWKNMDQYYYYNRGIRINRSNTTLDGITHLVEKEGANGYPYTGFYNVAYANNVLIENCVMTGHKTYVEDRDLNGDGIIQDSEINKGTSMGSYDIAAGQANNITWKNCTQSNFYKSGTTPYKQSEYWGVMGTNYCKNLTYDGCTLSRFDAHCGVYNATIKDSTIAFAINSVGAGTFTMENVTMLTGSTMLTLRSDYGSTWEGTVIIKGCELKSSVSTAYLVYSHWYDHDFGYTCYIPNIIVDNFTTKASTVYAYRLNSSSAFSSTKNPLTPMDDYFLISRNQPSGYTLYASNNSTINSNVTITEE